MLIEILSQSNYKSFNIKIAHLLGLETAVYLNALIEINEKAIRKEKISEDGFFTLDRKYISDVTTLSDKKQLELDIILKESNILEVSKNNIKINLNVLTSISMTTDESLVADLSTIRDKANYKTKNQFILHGVKQSIDEKLPGDLKEAYYEWLEAVNNRFGYVTKQMAIEAQKKVDAAATHDLNKAIDIVHIATANSWKDMKWAIQNYNENNKYRVIEAEKVVVGSQVW